MDRELTGAGARRVQISGEFVQLWSCAEDEVIHRFPWLRELIGQVCHPLGGACWGDPSDPSQRQKLEPFCTGAGLSCRGKAFVACARAQVN
ncbi:hypothetical protein, partial [Xanthomonas citri]|uniref:hypothetical protein n=1 Tax=Xanthomonas citri TaxID=346 RepID=UPI001C1FC60A